MRILMLSQWFTPEPDFKGLPFAKALVQRGHQVEVLTGFPNYPGGKLYDGYRIRPFQRELVDGISVLRAPLYPSHDSSAKGRIANYGSFALSAALLGVLMAKKADVMYVYHPPATVALPAGIMKILRGIPVVYDIQDLWPDTLAATGMLNNPAILKTIELWCGATYRLADRIVVLSPGFKEKLVERGVPAEKIEVIYNWSEESTATTRSGSANLADSLGMTGKFNVLFAGTMGKAQGLDAVLDAAGRMVTSYPAIQFVFVGGGVEVERLKGRVDAEHLANVKFLPRIPMSEIGAVLQLADVLLVHLRDDPLFRITIPSKTQAYLAAGKPILMAVAGDASDLVAKAQAGLSCRPEDADSIAETVIKFFTMSKEERQIMGDRGKDFYRQELALAVGVERFEKIFQAVARHNPGAKP